MIRPALLLSALIFMATAPAVAASPTVTVDAATQRRLGIATALLTGRPVRSGADSFGHVLDPTPLMTLDSDLAAAAAAAAASSAEDRRSRALAAADATLSRKAADAAAAQARADTAKVQLLRRRLKLEWGTAIATLPDRRRAALIDDLAAGRAALLKIDAPMGRAFAGVAAALVEVPGRGSLRVRFLGDSRAPDTRQAIMGKLAVANGPVAGSLPVGLALPARLVEGTATAGLFVPAGAVVRYQGASWVYLQRTATRFERRRLGQAVAQPDGLIVQDLHSSDRVVIRGSAQLLTAEQAAGAGEN